MPKKNTPPRAAKAVQADLDKVNKQRDGLLAEARTLAKELDHSAAYEKAQASVADMPDAERAALAQVIAAEGVESTLKTGTPGQ